MKRGNSRFRQYLLIFFFFNVALHLALAQEPVFKASVSDTHLAQNSVFQIQFELQNASGADYQPPSFQNFKVVGGPSVGSSTMIVNGVVSRSQSWSYTLLAPKSGTFTIGPATIVAGRKKISTNTITIEVVATKDVPSYGSPKGAREPVILRADVDAKQYYPGQQIILTYRLLFRENVQTVSTLNEDDYADFFIQNFSDFSREATLENINGQQYTSRIIKSMALFAHQSGAYTIDPMIMSVGINAPFPGNQGFFSMRRIQDVQVASEPLTINILPLPPGAPTSFSGAVGQYQMKVVPGKTNITTDEAFSFQVEITGNGDARRWDVPAPVASGDFDTYEPKILEDKVFDAGAEVSHLRSIAYQMIPLTPGDYTVFVPLSYFDPNTKKYLTITSDTMTIHVTQGTGVRPDSLAYSDTTSLPQQLMPARTIWLKDKFWMSIPHLLLFGMFLSGAGLGLAQVVRRRRDSLIPEQEKVRSVSGRHAQQQLDALQQQLQDIPGNVFFSKATEIYYRFLMERFSIPSSALDEAGVSAALNALVADKIIVERANTFFTQCLTVRYGGIPGGFTPEQMLKECRDIIDLLA